MSESVLRQQLQHEYQTALKAGNHEVARVLGRILLNARDSKYPTNLGRTTQVDILNLHIKQDKAWGARRDGGK